MFLIYFFGGYLPQGPGPLSRYALYRHFRALGWVVRPGLEFGVDLLLYTAGPEAVHATYGVRSTGCYNHP